jgi:thiol-disulfide isomerase/thioredoxin
MADQQMLEYIRMSKAKGQTGEQIKATLLSGGWQLADIEEALRSPDALKVNYTSDPQIKESLAVRFSNMGLGIKVGSIIMIIWIASWALGHINTISWKNGFAQAAQEAIKDNKPMMVFFYVKWCRFCKEFDSDTLSDGDIKKLAKQFICVKVDCEANGDLALRYKVKGYPTVIFLDKNANYLEEAGGAGPGSKLSMETAMQNVLRMYPSN